MSDTQSLLKNLYFQQFGCEAQSITPIAASGGNRAYFRIAGAAGSAIGTSGDNLNENKAFIYLAGHFLKCGINVPQVLAVSECGRCYLQTDAGEKSLFETLAPAREKASFSESDKEMLRNALSLLAKVQIAGANALDFNRCYPEPAMNRRMIEWDLNYFKYSFLKPVLGDIDEGRLQREFDWLADAIETSAMEAQTFMVRDFQSRNLIVDACGKLTLIDFQGGRRGPAEYDVASFLWQAKAAIPQDVRGELVEHYVREASALSASFTENRFRQQLPLFVLFRVLQTLGAYGFRGLCEKRPHFLASIASGVRNLAEVIDEFRMSTQLPYLAELADQLQQAYAVSTLRQISSVPAADNRLTVVVSSFSFKRGVPADLSGNGGGFVFDCRAIHNPGRYEQYKTLTGCDEPVVRFLEDDGEVFDFLNAAYTLADSSVERYLQRGFTSLCVAFGCTGGRHRSVYCAEAMARHISEKYPSARVVLWHREQNIIKIM